MTEKEAKKKEQEFLNRIAKSKKDFQDGMNESIKRANKASEEANILIQELKEEIQAKKVKA